MKHTLSVVVGYFIWTIVWFAGNALLGAMALLPKEPGQPIQGVLPLLLLLLISVIASLAAGSVAARIAKDVARISGYILAGLLLLTGILVQSNLWSLMPLWYHLAFLGLLVPVIVLACRPCCKKP